MIMFVLSLRISIHNVTSFIANLMDQRRPMRKRFLLSFATLFVLFLGSIVLDRLIGLSLPSHEQGLIFPRNVSVKFDTPEFSSTIKTNSMGFRDREFASKKLAGKRILAIGDSFTFGWGVEAEESWPKVLETRLRSAGFEVEVANLGKPGGSPKNYRDMAEKSIPLLHPDLLIVGILQGDDIAQMGFPPMGESTLGPDSQNLDTNARRPRLRQFTKHLYPNLLNILDQRAGYGAGLADEWQRLAQAILAGSTAAERSRLDHLDNGVRRAFLAGELNPSLVYLGVHTPDYFMETMDLDSTTTKLRISQVADELRRIKSAADSNNAKVIVVSVPYGIYVSRASFDSRQRIGFTTVPEMLTSNAADEAIRQASQLAGVDFYAVTDQFRHASINQQFFFELDGHFSRAGHAYFADALTPIIKDSLNTSTTR
jgi:lysophospholipase L1-like esterase